MSLCLCAVVSMSRTTTESKGYRSNVLPIVSGLISGHTNAVNMTGPPSSEADCGSMLSSNDRHSEDAELRPSQRRGNTNSTLISSVVDACARTQAHTITLCERNSNAFLQSSSGTSLKNKAELTGLKESDQRNFIPNKFNSEAEPHCYEKGRTNENQLGGAKTKFSACCNSNTGTHCASKVKAQAQVKALNNIQPVTDQSVVGGSKNNQSIQKERKFRSFQIIPKPFYGVSESFLATQRSAAAQKLNERCAAVKSVNKGPQKPTISETQCSGRSINVSSALISDKTSKNEITCHSAWLSDVNSCQTTSGHNKTLLPRADDRKDEPITLECAVTDGSKDLVSPSKEKTLEQTVLPVSQRKTENFRPNLILKDGNAEKTKPLTYKPIGVSGSEVRRVEKTDEKETSLREMGNTKSQLHQEKTRVTANKVPETPFVQDSSVDSTAKGTRSIPALIVSDTSVEYDEQSETSLIPTKPDYTVIHPTIAVERAVSPTVQRTIPSSGMEEKIRLRPNISSDSAYSSDSRSLSLESSVDPQSLISDGDEAASDTPTTSSSITLQLPPPKSSLDTKSNSSSSSSSSSSPSHPGESLRVISDYGAQRKLSSSSCSSFRSSLSFESEDDLLSSDSESLREHVASMGRRQSKAQSSWTKIRRMVIWSPFMQSFKKKYPWVQLAGHAGNFQPGEEGCILKKFCSREAECLHQLSQDLGLRAFAPEYHGVVEKDGEKYTRMQDLLLAFDCPSVMDVKMGIRTYLEDELVKAKIRPRLRHDMYTKMTEISPDEPTDEEHQQRAVTKPRYMQWREHVSSSSNLGFRIEGIKKGDNEPSKDYKLTKTKEQVKKAFKYFINNNVLVLEKYINRLKEVLAAAEKSDFFMTHEVIGSSLLFVHDHTGLANSWMIDFGKTSQLPDNKRLSHRDNWIEGNREDGYLYGLDNLIEIFEEILKELKQETGKTEQEDNNPTSQSLSHVTWTTSPQTSNESSDSQPVAQPQDSVTETVPDTDTTVPQGGRKPPLRRQVAATNSSDYPPATSSPCDVSRDETMEVNSQVPFNNNNNVKNDKQSSDNARVENET